MTSIKSHYSASELAAMRLICLPTTKGKVLAKAEREGWPFVEQTGVGGTRRAYAPPADVTTAIKELAVAKLIESAGKVKPAPSAQQLVPPTPSSNRALVPAAAPTSLKDWQKRTAEARAALLLEVDRVAQLVGREKAIMKIVIMAQDGTLPAHLAALVPVANAKSGNGGKRTLSRRTMHRWIADAGKPQEGERLKVNALAPKDQHAVTRVPDWAGDLLAFYQSPQGRSLRYAVEQIAPQYGIDEDVLYHRARRFIEKMGNVELQVGRMGSRAIKDIKPFVRRDSTMLWPTDVYTADGHTFDAEIAHPVHGRPFRPELTGIVDVSTRRYVGWSVDLAESGLAVLDAIRHACQTNGIPALFYVDNGSGYHNSLMTAPGVGMESRLGFTMTHSIAYNSQARGIIEKSHQSVWVRAAKELPTYIGATMDAQASNKIHKITRRDVALTGRSKYLMPFNDFLVFCRDHVDTYNNKPHRGLAKVYDEAKGRKRHMTPNEAWELGIKDGAKLVTVDQDESIDLFRPQKEVKVIRGEIKLFNNIYFSRDLTEYHGDVVRAAYDIHDAKTIWIHDQQGRFVCTAEFEANKRAYFPESFIEQAARKRADGRARRLENKLEEVRQERDGTGLVLENAPSPTLHIVPRGIVAMAEIREVEDAVDLAESRIVANAEGPARPIFMCESERYEWLMQNRSAWSAADKQFLVQFTSSDIYDGLRERFEILDLAWTGMDGPEMEKAV